LRAARIVAPATRPANARGVILNRMHVRPPLVRGVSHNRQRLTTRWLLQDISRLAQVNKCSRVNRRFLASESAGGSPSLLPPCAGAAPRHSSDPVTEPLRAAPSASGRSSFVLLRAALLLLRVEPGKRRMAHNVPHRFPLWGRAPQETEQVAGRLWRPILGQVERGQSFLGRPRIRRAYPREGDLAR
jgi:hypothetical protein